jgi:hypothetical protein
MADITMCGNEECKIKERCYRWTAPASSHWQSYSNFQPNSDGTCDFFVEDKRA